MMIPISTIGTVRSLIGSDPPSHQQLGEHERGPSDSGEDDQPGRDAGGRGRRDGRRSRGPELPPEGPAPVRAVREVDEERPHQEHPAYREAERLLDPRPNEGPEPERVEREAGDAEEEQDRRGVVESEDLAGGVGTLRLDQRGERLGGGGGLTQRG